MSNKPKHSKTNITKISAKSSHSQSSDSKTNDAKSADTQPTAKTVISKPIAKPVKSKKSDKPQTTHKADKKAKNATEKPLKEVFILVRPFVALGRYLRDSWREIRQVRWPNRKLTWKMTFAVLVYCAIFIVFIVLLDTFFTFIFNLLINAK